MAWRLEEYLIEGYFNNLRRNSTFGIMVLRGCDRPMRFDLTGMPDKMLQGRAFEYRPRALPTADLPDVKRLQYMQVGTPGTMLLRMVKTFRYPIIDVYTGKAPKDFDWKPCLYLEWFGQNGRMVLELPDPEIEMTEGEPIPMPAIPTAADFGPPSVTVIGVDDEGEPDVQTYQMKTENEEEPEAGEEEELDAYLEKLSRETEQAYRCDKERRILELEGFEPPEPDENSEYLGSLLKPQRLPAPFDVDEEKAEELVTMILNQLAIHGVAVHLCEHCSQRQAYEYILTEILQKERVSENLAGSGWTQNYNYGESCPECEAESEAENRDNSPEGVARTLAERPVTFVNERRDKWTVPGAVWGPCMQLIAEGIARSGGERLLVLWVEEQAEDLRGFDMRHLQDVHRHQLWAGLRDAARGLAGNPARAGEPLLQHLTELLDLEAELDPTAAPRLKIDFAEHLFLKASRQREADEILGIERKDSWEDDELPF